MDPSSIDSLTDDIMTDEEGTPLIMTGPTQVSRLKGLLKMISSQCSKNNNNNLRSYDYDFMTLIESQSILKKKRKRTRRNRSHSPATTIPYYQRRSFDDMATQHRYVCFFVIQGNTSNFYSNHTLSLRRRLSQEYHDVMTTFLVSLDSGSSLGRGGDEDDDEENTNETVDNFCQGTGFCYLPERKIPLLRSMLNISQVPSIVILNVTTGQKLSDEAMLAMEWNDSHTVINAWQKGQSGLTCMQKMMAILTFQGNSSPCTIQ